MTSTEAVKLSRVYKSLLYDMEAMFDLRLREAQRQRMLELIKESVGTALHITSQRCPTCDSADITVVCGGCARDSLKQLRANKGN